MLFWHLLGRENAHIRSSILIKNSKLRIQNWVLGVLKFIFGGGGGGAFTRYATEDTS